MVQIDIFLFYSRKRVVVSSSMCTSNGFGTMISVVSFLFPPGHTSPPLMYIEIKFIDGTCVIGSDVPWLDCPAYTAITWVKMVSVYNIIIRIMAAILDFGPKWQFAMGGFGWTFFWFGTPAMNSFQVKKLCWHLCSTSIDFITSLLRLLNCIMYLNIVCLCECKYDRICVAK